MYRDAYGLDYTPVESWEVAEARWPFAYHLNATYRSWVYLRRVLRIVKCVNPVTGEIDTPFESFLWGIGEPDGPFESLVWDVDVKNDSPWRWTDGVRQEFHQSETALHSALNLCVASLSEEATAFRIELWGDDIDADDAEALLAQSRRFSSRNDDALWQFAFLHELGNACSIVGNWEQRLDQLRNEEVLMLWKHGAVMRGAREGGRVGGEGRRKVSAPQVRDLFDKLAQGGTATRDAAAIIAKRLNIHPDHARRLRRAETQADKERRTKPT
jgi:hypothetical protein